MYDQGTKYRLLEKLPCSADGAVPGQFFIDVIIQEKQDIHPHGAMVDKLSMADDVLQISNQA